MTQGAGRVQEAGTTHPPTHPGVPTGLNFPASWDWTCDGTACFCGDTEGPSDSPVFTQLLNCKAGVCVLGPFDPRFAFFLRDSVSLSSSPQVPCLPLWPTAFWGIVTRITPWTGLDGRILHGHSLHREHPPGKYLNSGLDSEKFKPHARDERRSIVEAKRKGFAGKEIGLSIAWALGLPSCVTSGRLLNLAEPVSSGEQRRPQQHRFHGVVVRALQERVTSPRRLGGE